MGHRTPYRNGALPLEGYRPLGGDKKVTFREPIKDIGFLEEGFRMNWVASLVFGDRKDRRQPRKIDVIRADSFLPDDQSYLFVADESVTTALQEREALRALTLFELGKLAIMGIDSPPVGIDNRGRLIGGAYEFEEPIRPASAVTFVHINARYATVIHNYYHPDVLVYANWMESFALVPPRQREPSTEEKANLATIGLQSA